MLDELAAHWEQEAISMSDEPSTGARCTCSICLDFCSHKHLNAKYSKSTLNFLSGPHRARPKGRPEAE